MRSLFFVVLSILTSAISFAQTPVLNHSSPSAAAPGKTNTLTLFGDNLAGSTELWASFPAQIVRDSDSNQTDSRKIRFRMSLPPAVRPGIGAIRLATTNGISNLQLFMIDDLPTIPESGTNKSVKAAQELQLPVAVDGTCEELSYDYYQVSATNGQRLSVEVVAQRLGSAMDPVVRLLDSKGRELAYSEDSPGAMTDARFTYLAATTGKYFIEVRDTRYQGGSKYRYRLRVGEFALTKLPYLPVTQAGFKSVSAAAPPTVSEVEPNDASTNATRISLPTTIQGHFEKNYDRDFYEFEVPKDQKLAVIGKTRSLGSPCDLFMQIYKADDSLLVEANPALPTDSGITNNFKGGGRFRLLVEELNRGGGPEFDYSIELRPHTPGFDLSVETDKVEAPAGGSFEIKVSCARRDYDGPIMLSLAGAAEGFEVKGPLLPARTNETQMKIAVPKNLDPGRTIHFSITGYAKVGNTFFETTASTMPALRKLFPQMLNPPPEFDGLLALGVKPAGNAPEVSASKAAE